MGKNIKEEGEIGKNHILIKTDTMEDTTDLITILQLLLPLIRFH